MKIHLKNIGSLLLILIAGSVAFSSCESEKWNEHYNIDPSIVSEKNIWETIKENPQFSKFAWAVKKTGFDEMLSSAQMFTIWVPENDAVQNIDTTDTTIENEALLKEFVQNHISKFSYPASGTKSSRILLLNKKQLTFKYDNEKYYIGQIELKQKNIVTKNGIIHVIGEQIPFFSNIWEYLSKGSELDSIRAFLFSHNKIFFDESKSIPGDVNEEGQTVYLDSVIYNYNTMFFRMGAINDEDSTYSMILPNNSAWNNAYQRIDDYYKYYYSDEVNKIGADTMQRKNTLYALTQDLVFSHTIQDMSNDSLQSTFRNKFFKPLENNTQIIPASNGKIYLTDELRYKAWESWQREILIEAERSSGRESTWSNVFDRNYQDVLFSISKNKYIEVAPTSAAINPTVSFEIPNTLSGKLNPDSTINYGGAYNIYCVFAPNVLKTLAPKRNKVSFGLTYMSDNKGKIVTVTFDNNKKGFETDSLNMTKVLVASKVTFPYCEYGLPATNVKLKVSSLVSAKETSRYTREMLIDCVILEPVR